MTLKGWKAIAGHFGRDERTVMRWADQRGLPVRRLPGGGRSSVFALSDELDAWLAAKAPPADAEPIAGEGIGPAVQPEAVAPRKPPRRWRLFAVAAGLLLLVALLAGLFVARRRDDPLPAPAAEETIRDPVAEQAFLRGSYDLNLRTPESLRRAAGEFGAAIASDPSAAPAYAGLGETYLLLREYSDMPDGQAFARAASAASAAIALDPDLASAHRVLAFVAFWHARDPALARGEFRKAIALAPRDALTRHWYATALTANAEYAAALDQMAEARRLDPQSTALLADYGLLVALSAGRREEGLTLLRQIARDQPGQMSAHAYIADLALGRGDGDEYLREAAEVARLRGDTTLASDLRVEAAAARRGGSRALLVAVVARQSAFVARTHRDYYGLARLVALQGDWPRALGLLRTALAHHEARAASLPSDLFFQRMHDRPGFAQLIPQGSLAP